MLRFLVDRAVSRRASRPFPYGTLVVNLTGAVVLGFVSGLALSPHVALLAGTALVGSYTTFSTWMLETQRLGEERQVWPAVANIGVSVVLGVAAAAAGPVDRSPPVTTDYLKLTAYFGERLRTDPTCSSPKPCSTCYGAAEVATSVVLRGIAELRAPPWLRSDESLSMSEDPPIAVAAVDTADKITALADRAVAMTLARADHARTRPAGRAVRPTPTHPRRSQTHRLRRPSGTSARRAARHYRAVCDGCTATGSPAPQCSSASTAPRTASDAAPASSAAMPTSR